MSKDFERMYQGELLNPEAGAVYTEAILRKGGGRDPNQEAFFSAALAKTSME